MTSTSAAPVSSGCLSPFDEEWERIASPGIEIQPIIGIETRPGPARVGNERNRRRGERVVVRTPALLTTPDFHDALHCTGVDLSLSGVILDSADAWPQGCDVARLSLMLPGELLHAWVRLVRTTPRGRAVEFVRLPREERVRLARYIRERRFSPRALGG